MYIILSIVNNLPETEIFCIMVFVILILNNNCNLVLQCMILGFKQDFLRKNIHHSLSINILIKHFINYRKVNILIISCKGSEIILILSTIKFIIKQLDLVFIK